MAAKVGISTVSYGIGVQNRYSAFLEDDEGFISPAVRQLPTTSNVLKSVAENKKASGLKSANNAKPSTKPNGSKQESQAKQQNAATNVQKSTSNNNPKADISKRQRQQQGPNNRATSGTQQPKPTYNRQPNPQNDGAGNQTHSRPVRYNNQSNGNQYQSNQPSNRENHQQDGINQTNGRPLNRGPRDQRFNNRRQNVNHEEEKRVHLPQSDGTPGLIAYGPSNEEEKRRRQQKRANDLRFKDPEKKEARRIQANNNTNEEQLHQDREINLDSIKGDSGAPRGQRNRRDGDKFENGGGNRSFKGRVRGRRSQDGNDESGGATVAGGERQSGGDGQLPTGERRRQDGERSQRNRNGFGRGSGSRGDRGPRASGSDGNKAPERQKPIPNFSDQSDFPSLVA